MTMIFFKFVKMIFPTRQLLTFVLLMANFHETGGKTPLYVGAMFPMTSPYNHDWTGGNGIQPAAQMAFDHVNAAGVLKDYELKMIWNDTRGFPGWAEHVLFEFLHNPPRKIMLLGAGYSFCSTVIAALAGLDPWKIPQISYSSSSPELSDKKPYPHFYRTIPDDTSFNAPRIVLLKTFGWKHVGTIFQEEDLFRTAMSDLHVLLAKEGIEEISSESFRESAHLQMENLKKKDARIIVGNFFGSGARKVFCEAYRLGMYGAKYVWILLGYMDEGWWLVNDSSVSCSSQQLLTAMDGHLATDYLWTTKSDAAIVSGKTVRDFLVEYESKVKPELRDVHRGFVYDAVWAMALALNKTVSSLDPVTTIDQIPYGDKTITDALTKALKETNFSGVTGPVGFTSQGDRAGNTRIVQMINGKQIPVGLYHLHTGMISWTGYHDIVWAGGSPPLDRTKMVFELLSVSLPLFIFVSVLTSFAIVMSLFFLWFNITKRSVRFIKMSSPNLNNSVLLGCMLSYLSVFLFGLDGRFISSGYEFICASRVWTLSLGFSLSFGAMFSKTWRVHQIFTNKNLKRKIIKDRHLFAVVFLLVIVDAVYLTVWQAMDPMRKTVKEFSDKSLDLEQDILYVTQLELCECADTYRWLGILCGYKGLLLLFGAFLAWETRNVTIPALNDSKYVGMSVYNVLFLCVIGTPISLVTRETPDASFAIVSICVILCTSITMCLVFIPKVLEMKRLLPVGDQFCRTFAVNTFATEVNSTMGTVDINKERLLMDFKRKMDAKDNEIRELRLRLSKVSSTIRRPNTEQKRAEEITPMDLK
ncbi:gamma-aminobutyric acid type B receptor subunit 1-like isoform X2 [Montipora capricornis]|uniref:gamma-aminobutyric acid type B receptor subunit 1-like isoform X2 n=1 Tax=Montipora capricornis TaxID=246305 RepID=UPI0035F1FB37